MQIVIHQYRQICVKLEERFIDEDSGDSMSLAACATTRREITGGFSNK